LGVTDSPKSIDFIVQTLKDNLRAECKVLPFGKKEIKRLAVCSGGGADYGILQEAIDSGADLYLTGDSTEVYHTVRDIGFNVIFAGHHATEIVGVRALAEVISKELCVETLFFDIPTGL
jgi:putative NIF3 family GTP cyclohydrolase 1 type 2